jgi:hypothetical protein
MFFPKTRTVLNKDFGAVDSEALKKKDNEVDSLKLKLLGKIKSKFFKNTD